MLEQRGFDARNVRAVTHGDADDLSPLDRAAEARGPAGVHFVDRLHAARDRVQAVRNIARELPAGSQGDLSVLKEPAEVALLEGARAAAADD